VERYSLSVAGELILTELLENIIIFIKSIDTRIMIGDYGTYERRVESKQLKYHH
jgi:hypothetical protein